MEHDVHGYKPLKHLQTPGDEKAFQEPFQTAPYTSHRTKGVSSEEG